MKFGSSKPAAQSRSSANRSEEIRQRRTERSQKRVSSAAQHAAHPVRVRPVVVRGNAFGTPIHRQASRRAPRRAFYVTMDQAAGSELRLPSIPLVNPGWRVLSALIVLAALFSMYMLWNDDTFRVETAEVTGLQRISAEEVTNTLDIENLSIVEIDAGLIAAEVAKAFPELVDVHIKIELPNRVSIAAQERQPVAAWQKGDSIQWLDAEGVLFPARGDAGPLVTIQSEDAPPMELVAAGATAGEAPDAASAEGDANTPDGFLEEAQIPVSGLRKLDATLLTAAQALSQKLPPDTRLVYSSQDGLGWVEPQGWQVYIGADLSNFEAKFNMYQSLVQHLANQGQNPVLVSVKHLDAPFYRLEP